MGPRSIIITSDPSINPHPRTEMIRRCRASRIAGLDAGEEKDARCTSYAASEPHRVSQVSASSRRMTLPPGLGFGFGFPYGVGEWTSFRAGNLERVRGRVCTVRDMIDGGRSRRLLSRVMIASE